MTTTTATAIGTLPGIPALGEYGIVTGDTSGLADIHGLVGGPGTARWKTLINGMHLPGGGWKIIEYVELPPGAGCGRHLHAACEEIYYIVSGQAVMTVNGEEIAVEAGDLITCPLGTIHGISTPADAAQPMAFFVVEVFPGSDPPHSTPELVPMLSRLDSCAGYRGGGHGQDTRVAVVDLSQTLTGLWRRFSLIEIPAAGVLGPYDLPGRVSEVLFVTSGAADITVGDVTAKGQAGLCVGTGLHAQVTIANRSDDQPLTVISTEVAA